MHKLYKVKKKERNTNANSYSSNYGNTITKENNTINCHNYCKTQSIREVTGLFLLFFFFFQFELLFVTEEVCMKSPPDHIVVMTHQWHQRWQGPEVLSTSLGRGWQRDRRQENRERGGERGRRGRARFHAGPLRVGVETLLWAGGVDVMKLLLLLRLDVLILLHPAGVFHIGPVCRQNHQVVDLIGIANGEKKSQFFHFHSHLNVTETILPPSVQNKTKLGEICYNDI